MKNMKILPCFLFLMLIFSCGKDYLNPYDRECPPDIWSPDNLSASGSTGGVVLTWDQEATHFDGFLLERSTDSINWVQVNSALIDKSQRTYTDSENQSGVKVWYRISAKADLNQSNYSYTNSICPVPAKPGSITGVANLPENSQGIVYSIAPVIGATSYLWTVPSGATITIGQGTPSITVDFGITGGNVTVVAINSCGNGTLTSLAITLCPLPSQPAAITGKTTVIQNSTGKVYSITPVPEATSYTWNVPQGAVIVSGQGTASITVNFGTSGGNLGVRTENSCGNSAWRYMTITVLSCNSGYFTDSRDGRIYKTIQIGTQVWMAENLAYLPSVTGPEIGSVTVPCYYVYNYYGSNVSEAKNTNYYITYGVLYNWPAAMSGAASSNANPSGVRGICPQGWHLPSYAEWRVLENYLTDNGYGYGESGNDLAKSLASTTEWNSSSIPGTPGNDPSSNNTSCFSGFPVSSREGTSFENFGNTCCWWYSTEFDNINAYHCHLTYSSPVMNHITPGKDLGFSVRCVKD